MLLEGVATVANPALALALMPLTTMLIVTSLQLHELLLGERPVELELQIV